MPFDTGLFPATPTEGELFEGEPFTGAAWSAWAGGCSALLPDPLPFDDALPSEVAARLDPPAPLDAIAPSTDFDVDGGDSGDAPSNRCTATAPP